MPEVVDRSDRRDRKNDSWHVEKVINLSHVLTTVVVVASVIIAFGDLDKRIAILENNQERQVEMRDDIREIKNSLAPLPGFMDQKNRTDESQWERIREIREEVRSGN